MANTQYQAVKITVLKKLELPDIHKEYAADGVHAQCAKYKEGHEYICTNVVKPEEFCSWTWVAVQDKVVFLALGHDYPWVKQPRTEMFVVRMDFTLSFISQSE